MKENCAVCRFFEASTTKAFPVADGRCRRWAPRGPVIGSQVSGWQVFPPMTAHQWCGEFEPTTQADAISNLLTLAKRKAA